MPLVPVLPIVQDQLAEYKLVWLKRAPTTWVVFGEQVGRTQGAMAQKQEQQTLSYSRKYHSE